MTFLRVFTYSGVSVVIRSISGLLINKSIALLLGPTAFPLFGQLRSFIAIGTTVGSCALTNGVIKYTAEYSHDRDAQQRFQSTVAALLLTVSSLSGLLVVLFSKQLSWAVLFDGQRSHLFYVFGPALLFFVLNSHMSNILNGLGQLRAYVFLHIFFSVFHFFYTVLLARFWGLSGMLLALVTSQGLMFFVAFVTLYRNKSRNFKFAAFPLHRALLKNLAEFSLMSAVSIVQRSLSEIILRRFLIAVLSLTYTGYWQGMFFLSEAFQMVFVTLLGLYFLPKLSKMDDRALLRTELRVTLLRTALLSLGATLAAVVLRKYILLLLYTQEFLAVSDDLVIQMAGDGLRNINWVFYYFMTSKKMTKEFIATETIFHAAFVGLVMLGVILFREKGAALGYFAANAVLLAAQMIAVGRFFREPQRITSA